MISSLSIIETDQIGSDVTIFEYSIIRKNVRIGDNVIIHPFVVIEEGVSIGNGVEILPGAYIGKMPKITSAISRPINYDTFVEIGEGCSIGTHAVVYYDVVIGKDTLIGDGSSIREGCLVGSNCIIGRYVTLNYETIIGNHVKIMDHSWMAGRMEVEHNVFISGGVMTANDNEMGAKGYRESEIIGPRVREGARIGAGAILLPRIVIGKKSVVAAGSVVTKNVPDFSLVMGVPARCVKNVTQE